MIKVKLGQIIKSKDSLIELSKQKLPIKISYLLAKILKECDKELNFFEEERQKKIKEMGIENDKKEIAIPDEKIKDFVEELNVLGNTDIDLNFDKLKIIDLENVNIESTHLLSLDWLIE